MFIVYAAFGVWNSTYNVTDRVKQQYNSGVRKFEADRNIYGDPSPHNRKYLFIVWNEGGNLFSGVVGENDDRGFELP